MINSSKAEPLAVGDQVPNASALDQNGESVTLESVFADGTTLVYFYPKADTPGCTKQACNLRDEFESLTAAGIKVIGVSADSVKAQKAFADKFRLPFTLLADTDREVIAAFGVPMKLSIMPARQSFLIRDGKIIWRDLKAAPKTQAADALKAAEASASS